ncbi:tyrosine-type recombinase/integrase [Candidatus Peregrinibacteria bacterium]|nr:tyrosine-type recombinase/integrase [Candidatus Peregrinibacteria bacterium]
MNKSKTALTQHITNFLDWIDIEQGLSSKTQENYGRFLKKFSNWLSKAKLDHIKPHELSPQIVWQYRVYLSRQGHGPKNKPLKKSTQNYYLIALRNLMTFFAERDILALPVGKIKLARNKDDREVRFLNTKQLEKLLSMPDISTNQGLRDRTILEVFFSTGMRISELSKLDIEQIKSEKNSADIELSISGKGGRTRTVYISARAMVWVKKYLETRMNDKKKALFINYRAKNESPDRLSMRHMQNMIKKYALRAGLPLNTTPHVLRHSFATDLLAKGVDLKILQEFLGHKDISATQIYAHVTNKQLRDIHRKFHGLTDK